MTWRADWTTSPPDTQPTHWPSGIAGWPFPFVDVDASFVYNENGLRVRKTVNGVVTKYTLHGKNVVHMTRGNDELHFFYDAQGKPAVVVFNGTPYSYVKNLQGDIVAILDSNKNVVVSYVYDAWGHPISKTGSMASTLGTMQPFRYRGYVFDEETGLYYLRSRFYSPLLCRFTNADAIIDTLANLTGFNLFCYCENAPVQNIDPEGYLLLAGPHDAVKAAHRDALIALGHSVEIEVGFLKWGLLKLTGRADIIDATTGEVWEIKPAQKTFDKNPAMFYVNATDQLASYLWGTVQNTARIVLLMTSELTVGGAIPSTTISYNDRELIEYWCEGDGIIWYQVIDDNDERRKQRHAETAWLCVTAGAIVFAVAAIGASLGGLLSKYAAQQCR